MDPQSSLYGLNVVRHSPIRTEEFLTTDQDLLGSPDLAGHLDIWSSLIFANDEPLQSPQTDQFEDNHKRKRPSGHDDPTKMQGFESDIESPLASSSPLLSNTPRATYVNEDTVQDPSLTFDIGKFLRGFGPGADPFLVAPNPYLSPPPAPSTQPINPASIISHSVGSNPTHSSAETPTAKRQRTRKVTPATTSPPAEIPPSIQPPVPGARQESLPLDGDTDLASMAAIAEDKRRRNTAASARFRLKKKEREAALEKRSKELEAKVNELERECEALKKENGWLKGLVIGGKLNDATSTSEDLALKKEIPLGWTKNGV